MTQQTKPQRTAEEVMRAVVQEWDRTPYMRAGQMSDAFFEAMGEMQAMVAAMDEEKKG